MFGVVAVPRFVAIHIGRLQRISLKLRVRFASGRISDGDVDDVRKIVFVDFVGLIQLLPRLVLASTVQLHVDVLVDGKFVNERKDYRLVFKGSRNQRIIDVQKSLQSGSVILSEKDEQNQKLKVEDMINA